MANWFDGMFLPTWASRVDTPPPAERFPVRPIPVKKHDNPRFSIQTIHFASTSGDVLVSHGWGQPQDTEPCVLNLHSVRSRSTRRITVNAQHRPLAFSADGKLVISRSPNDSYKFTELLTVSKMDGRRWEQLMSFIPYSDERQPQRKLNWAAWLDHDHLLTLNDSYRLAAWNWQSARAKYVLAICKDSIPAVSPTGKYFAAPTNSGIELYSK